MMEFFVVVTEKVFLLCDESKLISHFRIIDASKPLSGDSSKSLWNQIFHQKFESLIENRRNKAGLELRRHMSTNIEIYQLRNHFLNFGNNLIFIRRKESRCQCSCRYDKLSNYCSFLNIRLLTESFEELMVQSEIFVQFQIFIWDFDWKIKPVIFEAEELENWDMSIVIAVLPLFIKQDCKSDVTDNVQEFQNRKVCLRLEVICWHLDGKGSR